VTVDVGKFAQMVGDFPQIGELLFDRNHLNTRARGGKKTGRCQTESLPPGATNDRVVV
jgi:hypothetical protein